MQARNTSLRAAIAEHAQWPTGSARRRKFTTNVFPKPSVGIFFTARCTGYGDLRPQCRRKPVRLRWRSGQKLRKRKSRALPSTVCRTGAGSAQASSMAPIIVEKIAKKARSLSAVRRPGMNGTMRFL